MGKNYFVKFSMLIIILIIINTVLYELHLEGRHGYGFNMIVCGSAMILTAIRYVYLLHKEKKPDPLDELISGMLTEEQKEIKARTGKLAFTDDQNKKLQDFFEKQKTKGIIKDGISILLLGILIVVVMAAPFLWR